jgi:hypothetical protein
MLTKNNVKKSNKCFEKKLFLIIFDIIFLLINIEKIIFMKKLFL